PTATACVRGRATQVHRVAARRVAVLRVAALRAVGRARPRVMGERGWVAAHLPRVKAAQPAQAPLSMRTASIVWLIDAPKSTPHATPTRLASALISTGPVNTSALPLVSTRNASRAWSGAMSYAVVA